MGNTLPIALQSTFPSIPLHAPQLKRLVTAGSAPEMSVIIENLAKGQNLSQIEANTAFEQLMEGKLSASQAGAFLLGLRMKGETALELSAAVEAILAKAVPVPSYQGKSIDIVGTGGDGKHSFNCSTATSLVLAGMGYKAMKHGNRSVSSTCGSADVLEQLGINLDTPPEQLAQDLENKGFAFLFAPHYHPAFQHVASVRKELGIRTLFNIIGPLVNPARPSHSLLGVADTQHLSLVANTLARTHNTCTGVVVSGAGGYDELTTMGIAQLVFVNNGKTVASSLNPAEYGFESCTEEALVVNNPKEATAVMHQILAGTGPKAMQDMVALNVGMALYLLDNEPENSTSCTSHNDCGYNQNAMALAMQKAKHAVRTGAGAKFTN